MKAVLLMAHGAPRNPDEVEEYVLRVRQGRPLAPELMAIIQDRYRRIGGSRLLQWTTRQAEALAQRLENRHRVYLGMRHSSPFIQETIDQMIDDGVESAIAICMTPQFSGLTISEYEKALQQAISDRPLQYSMVKSYARHPALIDAFTHKLLQARERHPEAFVIFTAHSLPERGLHAADPYDFEVKETARRVALSAGLKDWRFAYQSQGMTSEKWLGPSVESRIDELASRNASEVMIVPVGFVCDHLEILYDIDILYHEYAQKKGIRLFRTSSLNDSPEFINLLFHLVNEHGCTTNL